MRLLDFGLAQLAEEESLTATGDVPGTLAYMPPERLCTASGGPPADIWAVGVMLWESLAGWHPFWNGSLLETARRIETGAAPLAQARPDLPKPLCALVDRMLALDPAARPPAAHARPRAPRRLRRAAAAAQDPHDGSGADGATAARRAARPRRCSRAGPPPRWPFYPTLFAPLLALLAGALTLVRPRLGLAFALAVPVLPLGNISSGLALVYAAVACAWLALSWRAPRQGLFFALGPLLAPLLALGLLPLAAQANRSPAGARCRSPRRCCSPRWSRACATRRCRSPAQRRRRVSGSPGAPTPSRLPRRSSASCRPTRARARGAVLAGAAVAIPFVRKRGLWWSPASARPCRLHAPARARRGRRSAGPRRLGDLHGPGPQGPGLEFRSGA